jgi:hypothetical protein
VAGSVFKQVYIAEGMAPPKSFSVVQEAYKTMYARAIDPNFWSKMVNNGDWKKFAIYSIEVYGIFTIGEMVVLSCLHKVERSNGIWVLTSTADWKKTSSGLQD